MERPKSAQDATKTVRLTAARHRSLRKVAIDLDVNLIEAADAVFEAGVRAIRHARRREQAAPAN